MNKSIIKDYNKNYISVTCIDRSPFDLGKQPINCHLPTNEHHYLMPNLFQLP